MKIGLPVAVCGALIALATCHDAAATEVSVAAGTTERIAQFENEVRPILVGKCFKCHGGKKIGGGLRVDSGSAIVAGGESGPAVIPGEPENSLLMEMISGGDDAQMPPDGALAAHEVAAIARWIGDGAVWPSEVGSKHFKSARHWAFEPVIKPQLPPGSARHPIDRFIDARLSEQAIQPVERADARTLARRIYFDLIGLPPEPAAVNEFSAAFARDADRAVADLVDRLLASPRYGERWGRYWMDLVRYADTAGDNADYPIPSARLYRDWIIDALNADKPYDQFLQAQLAGDLLPHADDERRQRENTIATTFIALSRRYATEPFQMMHLVIEDAIDTTGQAMLGLTLRCARCHDHKFDPTTQRDYYALYGIFASTQFPFAGSEAVKKPSHLVPLPGGGEAYGVTEGRPHDVALQIVGDPAQSGPVVARGPPRFLLEGDSFTIEPHSSGRLEFARWLTRPEHPLTARVFVNRVWEHHFGKGIVATPSNFGINGAEPTHPELLDWLTATFVEQGWSIKNLHRLIMTSEAYQRASVSLANSASQDPANRWYWRFERLRLDAEEIRDAMLWASGELDLNRPGEHPFPPQTQWDFTQHKPFVAEYATPHRAVYLMTQRFKPHPFFALFDGPDRNVTVGQRTRSTVPLQSLYLMNNAFVQERAAAMAERLLRDSDSSPEQIQLAYRLALAREPHVDELTHSLQYLNHYRAALTDATDENPESDALAGFAKLLLISNEFLYVD